MKKIILAIILVLFLFLVACSGGANESNADRAVDSAVDIEVGSSAEQGSGTSGESDFVARDWTTDEFRFRTTSPTEAAIVSIFVDDAECVLPGEVDGYTITACYGSVSGNVRSLVIPDSISGRITGIGSLTFFDAHKDLVVTYKGESYTMVEGLLQGYYGMQEELFHAIAGTTPEPSPEPEPDPNEGRHHYAIALEDFNSDAVGHTAAVLIDLDGDGNDEVVAVKSMGGNKIIIAFYDFNMTPISRLQNKTIPEGYDLYTVTVSDTNRTPRVHFISEGSNKHFYEYYQYREDQYTRYELTSGTLLENPYLRDRTLLYTLYGEMDGIVFDKYDDHTEQILAMTVE